MFSEQRPSSPKRQTTRITYIEPLLGLIRSLRKPYSKESIPLQETHSSGITNSPIVMASPESVNKTLKTKLSDQSTSKKISEEEIRRRRRRAGGRRTTIEGKPRKSTGLLLAALLVLLVGLGFTVALAEFCKNCQYKVTSVVFSALALLMAALLILVKSGNTCFINVLRVGVAGCCLAVLVVDLLLALEDHLDWRMTAIAMTSTFVGGMLSLIGSRRRQGRIRRFRGWGCSNMSPGRLVAGARGRRNAVVQLQHLKVQDLTKDDTSFDVESTYVDETKDDEEYSYEDHFCAIVAICSHCSLSTGIRAKDKALRDAARKSRSNNSIV